MTEQKFEMLFWQGKPPGSGGHPGFNPRTEEVKGMLIERDVAVKMRDGVKIYVDDHFVFGFSPGVASGIFTFNRR